MRKKETIGHKKLVRKIYERLRQQAKTILIQNHREEYYNILNALKSN